PVGVRLRVGVNGQNRTQLVDVVLFDVGQNEVEDASRPLAGVVDVGGRERTEGAVIVVQGNQDLFDVVAARHAGRGFADLLHGGDAQADEDGDDGNHH